MIINNSKWSRFLTRKYYKKPFKKWENFLLSHAKKIGHPNPIQYAEEGWESRAGGLGFKNNDSIFLDKEINGVENE